MRTRAFSIHVCVTRVPRSAGPSRLSVLPREEARSPTLLPTLTARLPMLTVIQVSYNGLSANVHQAWLAVEEV
jgi:hypothetical protein